MLQFLQAEEEQRKADYKLTPGITATAVRIEKGKRKRDERENEKSDIELETEQCNDPRRQRRANISSHDDGHRLSQCDQTAIDKRNDNHRRSRRRLDEGSDEHAHQHRGKAVATHSRQSLAEAVASSLLQAFAHQPQSVKEKTDGTNQRQDVNPSHGFQYDFILKPLVLV